MTPFLALALVSVCAFIIGYLVAALVMWHQWQTRTNEVAKIQDEAILALQEVRSRRAAIEKDRLASDELLELAWGVIANGGNPMGDWTSAPEMWQDAARKWRDDYHVYRSAVGDRRQ